MQKDMTPIESDIMKLKVTVDQLYIAPSYLENLKATEVEIEIRQRLEQFKIWANKLIEEKIK